MRQVITHIGSLPIYGFGMMLFLAFILCTWLAGRRGEREGIKKETIQDLAIWIFVGGLLGARITFLLQENPPLNLKQFIIRLPRIWDGGIILYGSILGGLLAYTLAWALIYRKRGLQTRLADAVAPSIALGLCLGRVGCFLNGCCYGQVACQECPVYPVSFPMSAPLRELLVEEGYQTAAGFTLVMPQPRTITRGVQVALVDPGSRAYTAGLRPGSVILAINNHPIQQPTDVNTCFSLGPKPENWQRGEADLTIEYEPKPDAEPVTMTIKPRTLGLHPMQLYEVVSMLLLFLVLLAYEPFRRNPGQVAAVLMVGYGIHRYLNEILRGDPRPESLERYGSYICVALGVALWVWLGQKAPDPPVKAVSAEDAANPPAQPIPA